MFIIYLGLYWFNPKLFYIDEDKKISNYWLIDIFYFTSMIHTHVAIGDITPASWCTKLLVTIHIIIVFMTTCISLVDDIYDTVEEYAEDTRSRNSESYPIATII